MVAPADHTDTDVGSEDLRVTFVRKSKAKANGSGTPPLVRMRGVVTREALAKLAQARAQRHARILASREVDSRLPECKPEVLPPKPLFYEGGEDATSKAKLWGLHPVYGGAFKLAVRLVAVVLDIFTMPLARTRSRILYANFFRSLGFIFLLFAPFFSWGFNVILSNFTTIWKPVFLLLWYAQFVAPVFFIGLGFMCVFASIRQQNGASFLEKLRPFYDPIPAYEQGPVISIGHLLLSLKDCHTNVIAFGGIGSGKCWAPGTRMLMYDGSVKAVEDLRPGDLLMGPDSKPRRVLSTTRGKAPMYWISERGSSGGGWGCNDVHMLTLKHADGRPRVRWRRLSKARQRETGHKRSPWFDGLYEVSGVRSFGTNERTGRPIVPQDLAEVELKGFLERTAPRQREGFGLSRVWKMFRVPVDFEISERSKSLSSGEYYWLGWSTARTAEVWDREVFLQATARKRLALLAGVIDEAAAYRKGQYELADLSAERRRQVALLARTLGYVVRELDASLILESGSRSLSDLPVSESHKRARITARKGRRDPLAYDWKAEARGDGVYYGFTVEGDGRLLLEDCTVTHNTAGFVNPTLLQFFRKLNNPNHRAVDARWGGLVLDVKGDFIDFVIYCFRLTGRPLIDLVIIDPDIDLVRYNPLDSSDRGRFAEAGAAKLAAVQRIIGGASDSKDKYWNDTSKSVIQSILKSLQIIKETKDINLSDVGRYARDDNMVDALIKEARARLARDRDKITQEEYNAYTDSVGKLADEWVTLSDNTKSILKTTISGMLGPIVGSATLQQCFCRETNFDFRQVITQGKVVLFRGSALDRDTRRLIAVCLKMDFQAWAQRRNGSSRQRYGLDADGCDRTILFVCDEYQEYVTTGGEGDEAFYGVSRSCRVCAILATQHVTSLEVTINNENQTKTLINNICTKVFLNSPDEKTGKLGEYLGSQFEKEEHSNTVGNSRVLSGKDSGQDGNVSVSKRVQQHFRADEFANLLTLDMEKSRKPPWYSEAIVYHYNQWEKSPTKMYRTRLCHCYPPRDYMSDLSRAYDVILRDRNAQRIVTRAGLALAAHASEICEARLLEFDMASKEAEVQMREGSTTVELQSEALSLDDRIKAVEARMKVLQDEYAQAELARNERAMLVAKNLLEKAGTERTSLFMQRVTSNQTRPIRSSSTLENLVGPDIFGAPASEVDPVPADAEAPEAPELTSFGGLDVTPAQPGLKELFEPRGESDTPEENPEAPNSFGQEADMDVVSEVKPEARPEHAAVVEQLPLEEEEGVSLDVPDGYGAGASDPDGDGVSMDLDNPGGGDTSDAPVVPASKPLASPEDVEEALRSLDRTMRAQTGFYESSGEYPEVEELPPSGPDSEPDSGERLEIPS